MKLIIAGSRDVVLGTPFQITEYINKHKLKPTEVVSGTAKGVDTTGEEWAIFECIPIKRFPANWKLHGKSAGPQRNRQMAQYADALLLIWDGESRGSKNMKETMLELGKPVYEIIIKK